MTNILIRKGDWNVDTYSGKTMRRHREKMVFHTPSERPEEKQVPLMPSCQTSKHWYLQETNFCCLLPCCSVSVLTRALSKLIHHHWTLVL